MALYIDTTETNRSGLQTGIQRVVRNIASGIMSTVPGARLVIHEYGSLYAIQGISIVQKRPVLTRKRKLKDAWCRFRCALARMSGSQWLEGFLLAPRDYFGLNWLVTRPVVWLRILKRRISRNGHEIGSEVFPGAGDVLLLLDSTWSGGMCRLASRCRTHGCRVIVVIYDLIPLHFPKFCDELLTANFRIWLKRIRPISDGYICISRAVAEELDGFFAR